MLGKGRGKGKVVKEKTKGVEEASLSLVETEMRLLCWRHGHGHEKESICKILGFLSAPSLTTICTDPHTQQFHLLSPALTSWWCKSTIYRRCCRKPVTVGKWGSLSAFIGVGSSEFLSGIVSQRSLPHHYLKVMLISATLPHTWLVIALFKICLFCHQHCWICLKTKSQFLQRQLS